MITKNLTEYTEFENIRTIWNNEIDSRFHITKKLFKLSFLTDRSVNKELSKVVLNDNQIIAFIIIKTYETIDLKNYKNYAWISLCYTKKDYRNKGIMSTLIALTEKKLHALGYQTLLLGKDMNPFLCGIPVPFNSTAFFTKRGFVKEGRSYDLVRYIDSKIESPLRKKTDYTIRVSNKRDFPKMDAFFKKNFPSRWYYEFKEYVENGGDGSDYVIIIKDDKVIAFSRVSDSNKEWIKYSINFPYTFENLWGVGPLGVDSNYRGLSLGYDVTLFAVNHAIKNNAKEIIIDWTSKVTFYKKFGFDIWMQYDSLRKVLRG